MKHKVKLQQYIFCLNMMGIYRENHSHVIDEILYFA